MHLVDDVYLILAHGRQIGGFIAQVTDVIHAVVGGGINFRYIQNGALINAFADSTFTAGVRLVVSRQLTALAKILAQVVLPVPRVPVNR